MKTVVVYESMYGNTHLVADAIAEGIRGVTGDDVVVTSVDHADAALRDGVDLLVVGGPTHVHGMTRESTRKAAVEAAGKEGSELTLDPDAEGPGLRDWFDGLERLEVTEAAAFDTRMEGPAAFTGPRRRRASGSGCAGTAAPSRSSRKSFLVTKQGRLVEDEEAHARAWGADDR